MEGTTVYLGQRCLQMSTRSWTRRRVPQSLGQRRHPSQRQSQPTTYGLHRRQALERCQHLVLRLSQPRLFVLRWFAVMVLASVLE